MKRLLLILALTAQSFGSIAFVSCAVNTATSGTTIVITASPPNGDTVVVGFRDLSTNTATFSDNGTSTYTVQTSASANSPRSTAGTTLSVSGSPTTITVTSSGTITNGVGIACWYSGVVAIGNVGSSSATTSSTTPTFNLTMQDTNNFIVCMDANSITATTLTNNIGTMRQPSSGGSATSGMMDNTSASTGSLTCKNTLGVSKTWQISAVELRTSAVAATCTNFISLLGAGCKFAPDIWRPMLMWF